MRHSRSWFRAGMSLRVGRMREFVCSMLLLSGVVGWTATLPGCSEAAPDGDSASTSVPASGTPDDSGSAASSEPISEETVVYGAPGTDEPIPVAPGDWPWWRGPRRDGTADSDQNPPLQWSETQNVVWKTAIPGRGHGSPILVGERVLLATADETAQTQSLLCLDAQTGAQLWSCELHSGGFTRGGHERSTHASATPACDGERVYINFLNSDAIYCSAVSLEGERLWQQKVSDFVVHQGFGASPALYGSVVLVGSDHKRGGAVAALDRQTGRIVWRRGRPDFPNYTSPIILRAAGHDQLVFTGCERVSSFDPLTGQPFWEASAGTQECVTSAVTDGELVFATGGYPQHHVTAVRADGSHEIAWEKNIKVYVPSLLVRDGYIYAVTDDGVAYCWRSADGDEQWKGRLGGAFSFSPVLVGDRIYVTSESGQTTVFRADPNGFERLAESQLGNEVFTTPVIARSRIYHRLATHEDGNRQEWLYCLGESPQTAAARSSVAP